MNITLTKTFESYVKSKVANGDYNSTSAVVQEALLLLQEQDQKREILRSEIQKGIDSIEAGRYSTKTPRQIFNEVIAKQKKEEQQ